MKYFDVELFNWKSDEKYYLDLAAIYTHSIYMFGNPKTERVKQQSPPVINSQPELKFQYHRITKNAMGLSQSALELSPCGLHIVGRFPFRAARRNSDYNSDK